MNEPECRTPDEQSFGEALGELDRIVAELESGQLELEESLSRYERGVALLRGLQAKLADAQLKVTMLMGELESDDAESAEESADSVTAPSEPVMTDEEVPF
jgi:exodeoxyribonuclease VII small subunit